MANKIHIRQEFKTALELTTFTLDSAAALVHSGEIEIKGKVLMRPYFLEKA